MVIVCVSLVWATFEMEDRSYILFVKTSMSATVSSTLSIRLRDIVVRKMEKPLNADLFLYRLRPSSPWISPNNRPIHCARNARHGLSTAALGCVIPVTEADATRCRTARMTYDRVKGCGRS